MRCFRHVAKDPSSDLARPQAEGSVGDAKFSLDDGRD